MPTIRDVAKMCGYSIATVSRVLNGCENVSEETRNKVLKAIKEINYRRGENIKGSSYRVVGVLVPDLKADYYGMIAEGIEESLIINSYEMFLSTYRHSLKKEKEALDEFFARKVDGIILCTTYNDDEFLEKFFEAGIPVVAVDREKSDLKIDIVSINNYSSSLETAKYLYKMGHRKVLYVEGMIEIYSARERKKAYIDFSSKKNDFEVFSLPGGFSVEEGYEAIKKYLERDGKNFTAISFPNDWTALGGIKALKQAAINCPEDVSVVGFDDATFSKYIHPSLTTVKQPTYEMGLNAAKLLIERIEGKIESKTKRRMILPTKLILRDSVKKID
ncbi:LacI family DNA-binding transcriptional regulator [Petrotoga sp. 9PWA.NaAc.5.4]|uniref:LacI family DNA-binding transcriptional regulator n=1 Tax=Petrotoga sp. 9PWA.NaAc.5.4 TaxID=1434328 RepID=UPI000CB5B3E7|nr:LacI family DNA-binding transcriptional regulator [Petrotoga sp. 9PWA.NaAc.5.4]PNR95932.1 alanine racemase [Petrotoga sp. 9PWA.NaAc.5.4]